VSGLMQAEPDSRMTPLRRFAVGTIAGVLIGALLVAGFGIFGVIFPGGDKSWRQPKALIVEEETGARYVLVDGLLRPVLNYVSARLILGGEPQVARVSRNSLRGVPHGLPVGIPSAPDSLPDPGRTDGATWQVCSSTGRDPSGAPRPYVTVTVGGEQRLRPLAQQEALVVRTPAGQLYLVWNNLRLAVPSATVLGALGYAAAPQHLVGTAWLNALPAGPDLAAPSVPDVGRPGPAVGGHPTVIGQLFKVDDVASASQYFVVRADGLSPVTPTGAAMLMADPNTRKAYPNGTVDAVPLGAAALAAAPRSPTASIIASHPVTPPRLAGTGSGEAPCVRLDFDAANGPTAQVGVAATGPDAAAAPDATTAPPAADRLVADRVVVAPGAGLLVRDLPGPGIADGALYLLVDFGVRFPLSGGPTLTALGYDKVTPVPVPTPLLALFPTGPALDPRAARASLSFTGAPGSNAGGTAGGASSGTASGVLNGVLNGAAGNDPLASGVGHGR
jgi:type VII secretion protein EccB